MTLKAWKEALAARDPRPGQLEWLLDEVLDAMSAAGVPDGEFEPPPRERLIELKAAAVAHGHVRLEQLLDELIDAL